MLLKTAKEILGINLIGPDELKIIASKMKLSDFYLNGKIPNIPYNSQLLKQLNNKYLLILGVPENDQGKSLSINYLKSVLGVDPSQSEPCFYNQDWYLKEKFAHQTTLKFKWYLIKKDIDEKTSGKDPQVIQKKIGNSLSFPPAILTAYAFFAYYFITNGKVLWKDNFIWCSDFDGNGDRIYTGRYIDPNKINKNGFNIHRHLSIRPCYGLAPMQYRS